MKKKIIRGTRLVLVLAGVVAILGCLLTPALPPQTVVRDGITVVEGPRICNMRDLGSFKTADGRTLRKGRIYRSAALNYSNDGWFQHRWSLPAASAAYLTGTLGTKTDLDLRTDKDRRLREIARFHRCRPRQVPQPDAGIGFRSPSRRTGFLVR